MEIYVYLNVVNFKTTEITITYINVPDDKLVGEKHGPFFDMYHAVTWLSTHGIYLHPV